MGKQSRFTFSRSAIPFYSGSQSRKKCSHSGATPYIRSDAPPLEFTAVICKVAMSKYMPTFSPKEVAGLSQRLREYFPPSDESRFNELMIRWKAETSHISRLDTVYMNPAYQQIIGMGKVALPFIFRELEAPTGRWFWALKSITGFEPFAGQEGIAVARMKEAWLEWGRKHGYAGSQGCARTYISATVGNWLSHQEP